MLIDSFDFKSSDFKNLRLIIVDEEHDTAYKQDKSPRYNGRDVAVFRAKLLESTCLLGSATPALETLNNAHTGKYGLPDFDCPDG